MRIRLGWGNSITLNARSGNAPKTVLYLDHTSKMGGGEVALLNLASVLDRSRYTPVVVLASEGPLVGKLRAAGVETHVLPLNRGLAETRKETLGLNALLQIGGVWQVITYAARLAHWARARKVDVIHCNSLKADIYGAIAGRLAHIPVIWHVRDRIAEGYLPGPAAAVFRRLSHVLPQMVITNSESTRQCLDSSPDASITVVYSGVPEERLAPHMQVVHDGYNQSWFTDASRTGGATSLEAVISLIGRLAPWKGQHVFIDAASQVLRQFPHVRFWIVGAPLFGENEYEQQIRTQVEKLGIEEQVKFLGFQEDVPSVLNRTDIVVHASTHGEPFGQVVVEGMAAGRPVVATDGGALPEIIEHGQTGLLVPMGDAHAMAEAMISLLADPAHAHEMGLAGQQRVREKFTLNETVRKVQAVYDRLLQTP